MKYFIGIILGFVVLSCVFHCHTFYRQESFYENRAIAQTKTHLSKYDFIDKEYINVVSIKLIETKYFPWAIKTYEVECDYSKNIQIPKSFRNDLPCKTTIYIGSQRPTYMSVFNLYILN
jgi:hypothetical protein